jgi:hypothetical protein
MAGDVAASPVDEEDVSPVGAFEGIQSDPVAPLGRVVRGPDDRQRARIEQRGQPVTIIAASSP